MGGVYEKVSLLGTYVCLAWSFTWFSANEFNIVCSSTWIMLSMSSTSHLNFASSGRLRQRTKPVLFQCSILMRSRLRLQNTYRLPSKGFISSSSWTNPIIVPFGYFSQTHENSPGGKSALNHWFIVFENGGQGQNRTADTGIFSCGFKP